MANSLTTNPIYWDATASSEVTGKLKIIGIAWVSDEGSGDDIAVDDDLLITDSGGHRVIGKRAEAAGQGLEMSFPGGLAVNGIKLTVLDGGVVYVYRARGKL